MDIQQKLFWLKNVGISFFCGEHPRSITDSALKASAKISQSQKTDMPQTQQAQTVALQVKDLSELNTAKEKFSLSALKKTATRTVLGQGPLQPKLMCVLEAPDTDADRSGILLSGPNGELLHKMLTAIHLDPVQDVYITTLSPWRTPGNRPLTETERATFLSFLTKEIQLVQPKKIMLYGAGLAAVLLHTDTLAKARGTWHQWENIPTRVTLALNTVRATPQRAQAWEDLQAVEKLG